MKIKELALILFMAIISGSCADTKKLHEPPLPSFTIIFGRTGGFTNINPVYSINNSGKILKQSSEKEAPVFLKKLNSQSIDSIYLLVKQTEFLSSGISQTGNISNYMEFKQDTLQRRITWTDNSQLPPAFLKLHLYLLKLIKN